MRFVFMLLMALMLVLSACSEQSSSQDPKPDDQGETAGQSNQETTAQKEQTEEPEENKETTEEKGDSKEDKQESQEAKQDENIFKQKKPKYKMTENYYIKPIGDANPKVVLLTIDDMPDKHAVEMAKTLKKLNAPAIFYAMGTFIQSNEGKKKLKKIHDMGFPIGNHTMTHPFLSHVSKDKQRKEIVPVYKQIKKITGQPVKFFRAPHGDNTDLSDKLAKERDVLVMNWSYGYDWHKKYEDPEALTKIMLNPEEDWMLTNGSILLMHDRPWTAKALDNIVKGLRDKGYTILDPALLKTPQSPK